MEADAAEEDQQQQQQVLLFYKYHPLAKDPKVVELYRLALERLCQELDLLGRILVGCNEYQSEGINGTLAGTLTNTNVFIQAMTRQKDCEDEDVNPILESFWKKCDEFYQQANCQPLQMTEAEFKKSTSSNKALFPDLNIKLVKELIGTGGVLSDISLDEVHQGYLTPSEWHKELQNLKSNNKSHNDTILIDCRNTKEYEIGRFPNSIDPQTTTFDQFPNWVQQHAQSLSTKTNILMYCTGGIRCEKASAYIRRQLPAGKQTVRHLQGGIHKYLEEYGNTSDCLWRGKNFVFDGRGAHGASMNQGGETNGQTKDGGEEETNEIVVGSCAYCAMPHDTFQPGCVCTVCRELVLVCPNCLSQFHEYHCKNHQHLKSCYFTDLTSFSADELHAQLESLEDYLQEIAIGRKFKQKRKTIFKQCTKITSRLQELASSSSSKQRGDNKSTEWKCRNCGQVGCSGNCWGFHGLKRKRVLDEQQAKTESSTTNENIVQSNTTTKKRQNSSKDNNAHLQQQKQQHKQDQIQELIDLQLAKPPSVYRDVESGIRIPTSCTRILQSYTKGKWCGKKLIQVLQEEFQELSQPKILQKVLTRGLIRLQRHSKHRKADETNLNATIVITSLEQAESVQLQNMDIIQRIVHWHEPPVQIPNQRIGVEKVKIPITGQTQDTSTSTGDNDGMVLYVCNKPSTVPVHPAGPYLSNSLTIMVEAQEGLTPKSLIPCHRIDRVTSGLTICCTNVQAARLVQSRINDGKGVQKLYLAKVHGKFPNSTSEKQHLPSHQKDANDAAKWAWVVNCDKTLLQVDAPIETVDPANGIREITPTGKPSTSLFRLISYDSKTDTSVVACRPVTGRSHQLRVHLQWLGYPIVYDVQYGATCSKHRQQYVDLSSRYNDDTGVKTKEPRVASITPEQVQAAKEVCVCCRDVSSAYTPAQLLCGGHKICLHAYRYQIPLAPSKKKNKNSKVESPVAELNLQVPPPQWALNCNSEILSSNTLGWLTKPNEEL